MHTVTRATTMRVENTKTHSKVQIPLRRYCVAHTLENYSYNFTISTPQNVLNKGIKFQSFGVKLTVNLRYTFSGSHLITHIIAYSSLPHNKIICYNMDRKCYVYSILMLRLQKIKVTFEQMYSCCHIITKPHITLNLDQQLS